MYSLSHHCSAAVSKGAKINNVLKVLAGSDWGQAKETMLTVFKTLNRPTWEYGSPAWSQAASATGTRNLQCIQNAALRIVTGSHTMASMTHLHEKCMVLPVREHLDLLSSQYLLACHQKDHPANAS